MSNQPSGIAVGQVSVVEKQEQLRRAYFSGDDGKVIEIIENLETGK